MAYTAKDGKRFENQEIGRHYDRSRGDGEKESSTKKAAGEDDGEEQSIESVVDEHGPADKSVIEKDGDGYKVTSHHGDHKHVSKGHESLHAAHAHSMLAHGDRAEEAEEEAGEAEAPMHASPPGM